MTKLLSVDNLTWIAHTYIKNNVDRIMHEAIKDGKSLFPYSSVEELRKEWIDRLAEEHGIQFKGLNPSEIINEEKAALFKLRNG